MLAHQLLVSLVVRAHILLSHIIYHVSCLGLIDRVLGLVFFFGRFLRQEKLLEVIIFVTLDEANESLVSLTLPELQFRRACLLSFFLLVFEVYLAQKMVQLCWFKVSLWLL